jgi:hypothetical protein
MQLTVKLGKLEVARLVGVEDMTRRAIWRFVCEAVDAADRIRLDRKDVLHSHRVEVADDRG